jgi:hypothetical protein
MKTKIALLIMTFSSIIWAAQTEAATLPDNIFGSIIALTSGIVIITAYIKKLLGTHDGQTIMISIVIGLGLSALGYVFKLGIFNMVEWYYIFVYGLASILMANGLSTWDIIKQILIFLKLRIPEGGD